MTRKLRNILIIIALAPMLLNGIACAGLNTDISGGLIICCNDKRPGNCYNPMFSDSCKSGYHQE